MLTTPLRWLSRRWYRSLLLPAVFALILLVAGAFAVAILPHLQGKSLVLLASVVISAGVCLLHTLLTVVSTMRMSAVIRATLIGIGILWSSAILQSVDSNAYRDDLRSLIDLLHCVLLVPLAVGIWFRRIQGGEWVGPRTRLLSPSSLKGDLYFLLFACVPVVIHGWDQLLPLMVSDALLTDLLVSLLVVSLLSFTFLARVSGSYRPAAFGLATPIAIGSCCWLLWERTPVTDGRMASWAVITIAVVIWLLTQECLVRFLQQTGWVWRDINRSSNDPSRVTRPRNTWRSQASTVCVVYFSWASLLGILIWLGFSTVFWINSYGYVGVLGYVVVASLSVGGILSVLVMTAHQFPRFLHLGLALLGVILTLTSLLSFIEGLDFEQWGLAITVPIPAAALLLAMRMAIDWMARSSIGPRPRESGQFSIQSMMILTLLAGIEFAAISVSGFPVAAMLLSLLWTIFLIGLLSLAIMRCYFGKRRIIMAGALCLVLIGVFLSFRATNPQQSLRDTLLMFCLVAAMFVAAHLVSFGWLRARGWRSWPRVTRRASATR